MSTCVMIIFHEENDGVDVRVGYDKTPDATATELNCATVFAKQIGEIVRNMSCAQDLTQKWQRDTGNATALREALEGVLSALADAGFHPYVYGDPLAEAVIKARAALSAPARNCDRLRDLVRRLCDELESHYYEPASMDDPCILREARQALEGVE